MMRAAQRRMPWWMVAMALSVEKRHEAEASSSDTWDDKWR
jgi:hypothetical protein